MNQAFPKKKKAQASEPGPNEPQKGPKRIVMASWRQNSKTYNNRNGLTGAILEAYNYHHGLVLKPDSFWQAILTQFSFYVDANAEALRDRIVNFQGKKDLHVFMGGDLDTFDYNYFVNSMVEDQIKKNIIDESMTDWLLPNFTTTTPTDKVAAGVTVMSTLQAYFNYSGGGGCGLPKVTLLGEVEDWEILRAKIDRLIEFELPDRDWMQKWHEWLALILDELVKSRSGRPNLRFWETCFKHKPNGSGDIGFFAGWLTVFNVFTVRGRFQGDLGEYNPYAEAAIKDGNTLPWPVLGPEDLVRGMCKVPVTMIDNSDGTEHPCWMFAGIFRSEIYQNHTLVPQNDWCIATESVMRTDEPQDVRQPESTAMARPERPKKPKPEKLMRQISPTLF